MKQINLDEMDVEELACQVLGLDYDEIDGNTTIIDEELIADLGCDLKQFSTIIGRLLPLIDVGSSGLTGKTYKGFADIENQYWLIKTEV